MFGALNAQAHMNDTYYDGTSLQTINPQTLEVPETRMTNARAVQDYARKLDQDDSKRAWKRGRVNGLVDGNPPYNYLSYAKQEEPNAPT